MRFMVLFLFMMSFKGFAQTAANCTLVSGLYANSAARISDVRFETVVDIFTINNARTFSAVVEGKPIRLVREEMSVDRFTKLIFLQRKRDKVIRAVYATFDRSPNEAARNRQFYANVIVTDELQEGDDFTQVMSLRTFNYNFLCKF